MSVLDIVFVGQCEVFVCLDFVLTPPLGAKLIGLRMGCQFFKNVDFSVTYPLKSGSCSMSYLRGTVSVLEIVFVGQCEVFVCLDFVLTFPLPPPTLAAKLIGPRMGRQFFKNVDFSVTFPLIVRFTMYFRSNFLENSKPIHFWNCNIMRNQKINVGICADAAKAAIFYFQN